MHVYLVRKHGVAPAPGDELLPKKKFYPRAGLQRHGRDLHRVRDPVRAWRWRRGCRWSSWPIPPTPSYIPRPEWYFLFLFQTLKLFSGPLEVVGSVVLPGLAMLALILVPFIDRGQLVKVTRRTVAIGVRGAGGDRLDRADGGRGDRPRRKPAEAPIDYSAPTDWMQLSPEEMAGVAYFRQENCVSCHVDRAKADRKSGRISPRHRSTRTRRG